MGGSDLIILSADLDRSGLVWVPEIGDEVSERGDPGRVSILIDPQGMTPDELRGNFIWIPTVEQLVNQFEVREAFIYHAGMNEQLIYEAVVKTTQGVIETAAATLRLAFGKALKQVLDNHITEAIH